MNHRTEHRRGPLTALCALPKSHSVTALLFRLTELQESYKASQKEIGADADGAADASSWRNRGGCRRSRASYRERAAQAPFPLPSLVSSTRLMAGQGGRQL